MSDQPEACSAARFILLADVSAGLLCRVLEPLAKRDLTPDRLRAVREGDAMRVEIGFDALPLDMLHRVAGNLGQIVGVRRVEAMEGRHIRLVA